MCTILVQVYLSWLSMALTTLKSCITHVVKTTTYQADVDAYFVSIIIFCVDTKNNNFFPS